MHQKLKVSWDSEVEALKELCPSKGKTSACHHVVMRE